MTLPPPRRPGGMPPVTLLSDLAPVQHPQHFPNTPHRLPGVLERPTKRGLETLLYAPDPELLPPLPPGVLPSSLPTATPPGAESLKVYEPHRYARLIQGLYTAPLVGTGVEFLTEPVTRRNFLAMRNTEATGGGNIFIAFGQNATAQSWLVLTPGQLVLFDTVVPQNDCYAISSNGTSVLSFVYSTFLME